MMGMPQGFWQNQSPRPFVLAATQGELVRESFTPPFLMVAVQGGSRGLRPTAPLPHIISEGSWAPP